MNKKLSLLFVMFLFAATTFAQWNNVGGTWAFAPEGIDTIRGSVQGMACDPDGNVWVLMYGSSTVVNADKDTLTGIIAIYVYKPDGTQTNFSPIWNVTTGGGFVVDTLNSGTVGTGRGLRADNDGNMLAMYSGGNGGIMYRINYQTGEGMNKVELEVGSPLSPGVDENGNIYVGFVVPQNPIKVYDKDFNYVENAIDATIDFARTMLVSKDGMTIYHFSYPSAACYIYTKADEFSAFELADSIKGAKTESATWDPINPNLMYIGGGSDNDVPEPPFMKEKHYVIDVTTKAVVDSVPWVSNGQGERPRGCALTPDGNTFYSGVFSGGSSPCFQKAIKKGDSVDVAVTFQCDMTLPITKPNTFNPATDTLTVRGDFNGWGGSDMLTPSLINPNIYKFQTVIKVAAGDKINYKYAYITSAGTDWEGGDNRVYTFTANDIASKTALIERPYNDASIDDVLAQDCEITIQVDMAGAVNVATGNAFTQIDNVVICGGETPLKWPDGGWPDADVSKTIMLNDNGTDGDVTAGDNIWGKTITFPRFSLIKFPYKYGANYGLATNGGGNDNEAGMGNDHWMELTTNAQSVLVKDKFGAYDQKDITGVQEIEGTVPTAYALSQNYPNPFNPTTTINFAIPKSGMVTLKVYDILGQEVATLLNEYKEASAYNVTFDASKLTSGMYIYTITSGEFVSTKKMMLVK